MIVNGFGALIPSMALELEPLGGTVLQRSKRPLGHRVGGLSSGPKYRVFVCLLKNATAGCCGRLIESQRDQGVSCGFENMVGLRRCMVFGCSVQVMAVLRVCIRRTLSARPNWELLGQRKFGKQVHAFLGEFFDGLTP